MKVNIELDHTDNPGLLALVFAAIMQGTEEAPVTKKKTALKKAVVEEEEEEEEEDTITDEQLRKAGLAAKNDDKQEEVAALLAKYRVKNLTAVPQPKRAAFLKALKAL